jgi:hypothetical protein
MYLDGEMPAETLKERIEAAAAIYGNASMHAYNRDVLTSDAMPPLNTSAGQAWLWGEINALQPDLIIFDSIMCLLVGSLSDEETWAPMKNLIRQLSSRRIAQVWLHHTGHDNNKGFGTKTKEWEMDTVAMLAKKDSSDDGSLLLEFRKARLRTPQTAGLFKPQLIRRGERGWTSEAVTVGTPKGSAGARKQRWLAQVYWDLSDGTPLVPGHDGKPVRKVSNAALRQGMIKRGYLATENDKLPDCERKAFQRAREDLIGSGEFTGDAEHLWSIK